MQRDEPKNLAECNAVHMTFCHSVSSLRDHHITISVLLKEVNTINTERKATNTQGYTMIYVYHVQTPRCHSVMVSVEAKLESGQKQLPSGYD